MDQNELLKAVAAMLQNGSAPEEVAEALTEQAGLDPQQAAEVVDTVLAEMQGGGTPQGGEEVVYAQEGTVVPPVQEANKIARNYDNSDAMSPALRGSMQRAGYTGARVGADGRISILPSAPGGTWTTPSKFIKGKQNFGGKASYDLTPIYNHYNNTMKEEQATGAANGLYTENGVGMNVMKTEDASLIPGSRSNPRFLAQTSRVTPNSFESGGRFSYKAGGRLKGKALLTKKGKPAKAEKCANGCKTVLKKVGGRLTEGCSCG